MKRFNEEFEKEFEAMRQRMERMFGLPSRAGTATVCTGTGWRPSLDLYETSDEFIVLVDVAGIQPKDIEVIAETKTVRFSGTRCRPGDEKVIRIHQMEIDFGPFKHMLRLPSEVDPDGANSTYRDGFLVVKLPKKATISASITIKTDE